MTRKQGFRPRVDVLEARCCPALAVVFDGSNLTIGDGRGMGAPAGRMCWSSRRSVLSP